MPPEKPPHRVQVARTPEQRAEEERIRATFRPGVTIAELVGLGELTEDEAAEWKRRAAEGPPPCPGRDLALALRAEREHRGLSLADVAGRAGVEPTALHRIEIGLDRNPTVEMLDRYATALGLRLSWMLEREVGPTTVGGSGI